MSYRRFAAMIGVSTLVMYGLMYLNTYQIDHVRFSETRLYMALLMGAVMAAIMMGFMWSMYERPRIKQMILAGAVVVFAGSLWLVRSQATVGDVAYMKAMIPHHSIAINNASNSQISDPRVRELADEIIASQGREIEEMKLLIAEIERDGKRGERPLPPRPAVLTPEMQPKIREAVR